MKDRKSGSAWPGFERSPCPIASTLDIFGDRWTLVVVRDLINGKRQFGEFIDSPERISSNILADRLKRLVTARLVEKKPYQRRPTRHEYVLTAKGSDLLPVLQAMCRWGNRHIADTWIPPKSFMDRRAPT